MSRRLTLEILLIIAILALFAKLADGAPAGMPKPSAENVSIVSGGQTMLVLSPNGQLWVNPKVKPDEAAREFLRQVTALFPAVCRQPRAKP